jgi:hypothetical protein
MRKDDDGDDDYNDLFYSFHPSTYLFRALTSFVIGIFSFSRFFFGKAHNKWTKFLLGGFLVSSFPPLVTFVQGRTMSAPFFVYEQRHGASKRIVFEGYSDYGGTSISRFKEREEQTVLRNFWIRFCPVCFAIFCVGPSSSFALYPLCDYLEVLTCLVF